jgi:hypothetical protein
MWDSDLSDGVNPVFKGWLMKKSPNRMRVNRWQRRWFVLDGATLSWWEKSEHETAREPLGVADLSDAIVSDASVSRTPDIVLCGCQAEGDTVRDLFLRTGTVEEKEKWTAALSRSAGGLKLPDTVERLEYDSDTETGGAGGGDSVGDAVPAEVEIPYDKLRFGKHIGKGVCSECKCATLSGVDFPLAVKTLHNFEASSRLYQEFGRLVRAISLLEPHRNVCRFVGACTTPPDLALVHEKHVASLATVLHGQGSVPDLNRRCSMGLDVFAGLQHVHAHYGSHGSVRPLNCLVKADGSACICDFGFSKIKELTGGGARISNTPGLYSYTAPEILRSEPQSIPADVYSAGVVLLELVTLVQPLFHLDQMSIMGQYGFGDKSLVDDIPEDCDSRFVKLLQRCLCPQAADRIELAALVEELGRIDVTL